MLKRLLESAGSIRDLALVGVPLVYAAGFILWSLNAAQYGLGFLPVVSALYLIAGIPFLLIAFLIVSLVRLGPALERWASTGEPSRTWVLRSVYSVAIVAAFGMQSIGDVLRSYAWDEPASSLYAFAKWLFGALAFSLFYFVEVPRWQSRGTRIARSVARAVAILSIVSALPFMLHSVFAVYRVTPQEFGGFRPRCALLHLRSAELSEPLLALLAGEARPRGSDVRQSTRVLVFYSDDQRMLIKLPKSGSCGKRAIANRPTVELDAESIVGVTYLKQ